LLLSTLFHEASSRSVSLEAKTSRPKADPQVPCLPQAGALPDTPLSSIFNLPSSIFHPYYFSLVVGSPKRIQVFLMS
jgi:hypothetical protein